MNVGRTSFDLKNRQLFVEVDGSRNSIELPEFLSVKEAVDIASECDSWEEFSRRIHRIATADEVL